jgi:hypothetical protein
MRSNSPAQRGNDLAQVGGNRLAACDHLHAKLFDVALDLVDTLVARDHLLGQFGIVLFQRFDGLPKHLLAQTAHMRDLGIQRLEFLLVGRNGMCMLFHGA